MRPNPGAFLFLMSIYLIFSTVYNIMKKIFEVEYEFTV